MMRTCIGFHGGRAAITGGNTKGFSALFLFFFTSLLLGFPPFPFSLSFSLSFGTVLVALHFIRYSG